MNDRLSEPPQGELNFNGPGAVPSTAGWDRWQEERRQAMHELARKLGLPLQHPVEVRLWSGVILRGTLALREEVLFPETVSAKNLELRIGQVHFAYPDIEACVRLD